MTQGFPPGDRHWPLTRPLLLINQNFYELVYQDGSRCAYLPDGATVAFDAVHAYNFTPRHPREAGARTSIAEELIQPAFRHPMAVFTRCKKPAMPPNDLPESQIRAML